MIHGFVLLLLCQLAGEIASRGLGLPVPGPVLGLVLLFLGLRLYARRHPAQAHPVEAQAPEGVARVSDGLLQNLALLFVPAGAGVVQPLGLLREHGAALVAALVASTALTLIVTVFAFLVVARWVGGRG